MTDLAKRLDRPVVLVGLMGVGKSTVGRRLAKRLGLPFVDSDSAIADASGFSAAEVYERFGEQDFRDGERRLVARLVEGEIRVIATGGGAFVDPRTRELLNERAITIWLDAPVDVLAERTRGATPARCSATRSQGDARTAVAGAPAVIRGGPHPREKRRWRAQRVVESIVQALEHYLGGGGR